MVLQASGFSMQILYIILLLAISLPALAADKPDGRQRPAASTNPVYEIKMVTVPGGCFQMGDKDVRHEVCLDDFLIGTYTVTQGQWQQVMGNNPSYFGSCGDDCPVEKVDWNDVQEFIRRLNAATGKQYRLPTEAEWEYACRSGGRDQDYCGGNDIQKLAWYEGNASKRTHPVGQKQPNGLGIYDMSGNVWQWVQDWHGSYPAGTAKNPQGPPSGSHRVCRGGSWNLPAWALGSTFRFMQEPGFCTYQLGFRLAASFP